MERDNREKSLDYARGCQPYNRSADVKQLLQDAEAILAYLEGDEVTE